MDNDAIRWTLTTPPTAGGLQDPPRSTKLSALNATTERQPPTSPQRGKQIFFFCCLGFSPEVTGFLRARQAAFKILETDDLMLIHDPDEIRVEDVMRWTK